MNREDIIVFISRKHKLHNYSYRRYDFIDQKKLCIVNVTLNFMGDPLFFIIDSDHCKTMLLAGPLIVSL